MALCSFYFSLLIIYYQGLKFFLKCILKVFSYKIVNTNKLKDFNEKKIIKIIVFLGF